VEVIFIQETIFKHDVLKSCSLELSCLDQVSKFFCLMDISGAMGLFKKLDVGPLELGDYLAIGAIFSATDSVCTLQVIVEQYAILSYKIK
jgi:hypothetical protein